MLNLQLERLRALPQQKNETWQAAVFRMPGWVEEKGEPMRPLTALCVSLSTGMVGLAEPDFSAGRSSAQLVRDSLVRLATDKQSGCRPGRLEVRQPEVAAELRPVLADLGIDVVEKPRLEVLDGVRQQMTRHFLEGDDPAALLVPGVTIDHLRAFADAAAEFHNAAPWRYLADEDPISVTSPKPPAGLGWLIVMGSAGQEFGLAFFDSRRAYDRTFEVADPVRELTKRGIWSFTFVPMMELPFGDADAWEEHGLAVPNAGVYPFIGRFESDSEIRRPTPKQWTYVEGLLRALARSTESEMDRGRWTKLVPTLAGDVEYVLTLPELLEPVDAVARRPSGGLPDRRAMERSLVDISRAIAELDSPSLSEINRYLDANFNDKPVVHREPETPLERAQDLVYDAVEARGRRQLQLARKALEICPDCADAYVLLAERTSDRGEARALYAQAVAAGARALGPEPFQNDVGHFWGILETRPYMRARFGLGLCCELDGRADEAAAHFEELLRLNPHDNQGARYRLAVCLTEGNDLDRLEAVLIRHDEDSALWRYLWALWSFRKHGDCDDSRKRLAAAHSENPHVRKYLLGDAPAPRELPAGYEPGKDSEAVCVTTEVIEAWQATPGALDWLAENTTPAKGRKRRKRR
ncbi:MAG: tetratricopeptide repeat protein [Phycisphaerales bacterium]|nr:tetratricopeptide repeat protein [Phycisphaerales bacterium]